MKIHIVTAGEYDNYEIKSVHTTFDAAEKALAKIQKSDVPVDVRESAFIETYDTED